MDRNALQAKFRHKLGYKPDIENPKTFNEKILWRKLNDRRQLLVDYTDKYKAKRYVDGIVNVIPELRKPEYPFIAKPNHWSGRTKLITNSNKWDAFKQMYNRIKDRKYGEKKGEWAYWQIEPRLMIESKLEAVHEIKCFCFDGKCELVRYMPPRTNFDRHPPERMGESYHLPDGTGLDIKAKKNKAYKGELQIDLKPVVEKAEELSKDIDHVRVDMYFNGKIYFGEFTFYSGSGLMRWEDSETDKWLGEFWTVD